MANGRHDVPIRIHVHRAPPGNGEIAGSFTSPPAKVRVGLGTDVHWELQLVPPDAHAAFEVKFQGFLSPFSSDELYIATPAPRTTSRVGRYHYALKVTSAGVDYVIENCPEFEVG